MKANLFSLRASEKKENGKNSRRTKEWRRKSRLKSAGALINQNESDLDTGLIALLICTSICWAAYLDAI